MDGLSKLRGVSYRSFLQLGILHTAYVKAVMDNGREAYAAHAADGTFLWMFPDRQTAFAALRQHDMDPLSVH